MALISPLLFFFKETVFPLSYDNNYNSTAHLSSPVIMYLLRILPRCLYGVSNLLLYTALYGFICVQSLSSMKVLLIGLPFSVKGSFFPAVGATFAISLHLHLFEGYDLLYYGINIELAFVTLVIISCSVQIFVMYIALQRNFSPTFTCCLL